MFLGIPIMNLLEKPSAVLFDWDNTLVDSFPLIHASINHALEKFNRPLWTLKETMERTQRSARESQLHLEFGDNWEEAVRCYREYYQKHHIDHLKPMSGALELLNKLASLQIPLAIVSNKSTDLIHKEINHLEWGPYFSAICAAGDAQRDKPAPDLGELALSQLNISPSLSVWFVGDAPVDWDCASALGCLPIPIGEHHESSKKFQNNVRNCDHLHEHLNLIYSNK